MGMKRFHVCEPVIRRCRPHFSIRRHGRVNLSDCSIGSIHWNVGDRRVWSVSTKHRGRVGLATLDCMHCQFAVKITTLYIFACDIWASACSLSRMWQSRPLSVFCSIFPLHPFRFSCVGRAGDVDGSLSFPRTNGSPCRELGASRGRRM